MAKEAWVTLATNDSYAVGVLVLARSLQSVGTSRPLVVMVSQEVSPSMRNRLSEVSCQVVEVNVLDSGDSAHLALLARPELGITFTKLHCWTLTDYDKCVFLDADTLVIQNCDELFDREELSAAPDAGWPDCFNSGVFVFRPSQETYNGLLEFAVTQGSFDGGDQGLLNFYFSDWGTKDISRHLPFIYNMTATSVYSYKPAYKQFSNEVRIVHFAGSPKPWQIHDILSLRTSASSEHVALWWSIFSQHVSPLLSSDMEKTRGLRIATCPVMGVIQASRIYSDHSSTDVGVAIPTNQPHRQFQENTEVMKEEHSEPTFVAQPTYHPSESYEAVGPPLIETVSASFDPSPAFIETALPIDEGVPSEPEIPSTGQGFDWFAFETAATAEKEDNTGVAAQLAELKLEEPVETELSPEEQMEIDNRRHREAWERGEIDYKGKDAFENIWSKIDKTLRGASSN